MEAHYRDGEKIEFVENVFDLDDNQKQKIVTEVNKINKNEHKNLTDSKKIRTNLTDEQKESILSIKNSILKMLTKNIISDDLEEITLFLKQNMHISLTKHADDRLLERFSSDIEDDSQFSKLMEIKHRSESLEDLEKDAINVLIESDLIGDRIEWGEPKSSKNKSFPRINFHQNMNKINVITEIRYEESNKDQYSVFLIITVIKKD